MQQSQANKINLKILAIPSSIGLSHLTRLILIAKELEQRGAEVAFAYKKNNNILKHYDFKVYKVFDAEISDFSKNVFDSYTSDLVEQCVQDELNVINNFKPDLIIGDFRHTAAISSRIAKISYISVLNGYMTDYFNPVDSMIQKDKKPFKHAIASLVAKGIQGVQKRSLAVHLRSTAQKYGIKNLSSIYDFLVGDLNLITDIPEFCLLKKLPQNYHYIGPLIWEGIEAINIDFINELTNSKRLIYATTGNTGTERFINLIIDAFKNDPSYEVILTTGAFINPAQIPKISNIHVQSFIPGSEIIKKCHAAIHCGGNGTTYQVLSQGVPSVVIPFNNDQKINAWLIKKNRLGIPCSHGALTGMQVKLLVEKVIHDVEIKEKLKVFKNLLKGINAEKAAGDIIISFFNQMNWVAKKIG